MYKPFCAIYVHQKGIDITRGRCENIQDASGLIMKNKKDEIEFLLLTDEPKAMKILYELERRFLNN